PPAPPRFPSPTLFRSALPHLERLLRDRLIREDPDPDLAAALHLAGHRAPRRLDLAGRELAAADGLQTALAEAHRVAAVREAGIAALELLSEFRPFRLQHGSLCSFPPSGLRLLRARRLGGFLLRFAEVEDLPAEDPDLHADHAVRRARLGKPVVDVRAKRVQRHAAFAVPLRARDLRAVQPAGHLDLDAFGPESHRVRDRAAHRTPELHAALELLSDAFGDELRVELGLPDLRDVEAHVGERHAEQLRDVRAQLLDVLALLADHDARPCRVDRDVRALRRPRDMDAADGRVLQLLLQELADPMILLDVHRERLRFGVPLRQPLASDAEVKSGRMYFLTHDLHVRHSNRDVAAALQDSVAPALRARTIAGEERRAVDFDDRNLELVDVRPVIVLGVRDRRLEHLVHDPRGLLAAEPQDIDGLPDGLAPDLIRDETALLGRNARVS